MSVEIKGDLPQVFLFEIVLIMCIIFYERLSQKCD